MFNIDFFELLFLAEVCIPPVPIARHMLFDNLSNIHFHKMNNNQKQQMFKTITENHKFDMNNEDCCHFYHRFDPDNQFNVLVEFEAHKQIKQAYLYNDQYHITKNQFIDPIYIISIEKL